MADRSHSAIGPPSAVTHASGGVGEIVGDVRELVGTAALVDAELVAAAARGWAANTRRAFRSDLTLWGAWCRRRRIDPVNVGPQDVAAWIRALAGIDPSPETIRAMATIERYLVNIGWAYRMAGLDDPTAAPLVKLERKAARKALGVRQRQARALRFKGEIGDLDAPASGVCLAHLLKACGRDWLGLRDQALLRIAYDTACRRSELVAIETGHIEAGAGGAGVLFIPSSKTDVEGEGAYAYLSPATMAAIAVWQKAADIRSGPLLRRVEVHFDGSIRSIGSKALHPNSVTLIYRRLIRAADEKGLLGEMGDASLEKWIRDVSSHSIRVGVAQDGIAAGEGLPAIMQAYRWRDPRTVMRYGAKLAAQSGTAARLAKRVTES